MKLLLRETVDQLGTIGDIVNVPDGYGRNYLLPKGIALAVTPENIRRLELKKQELLAAEAEKRSSAAEIAERAKAHAITILAKASGEEGKLYGSVTGQMIADHFQKDGFPIEPRMVLLDHPLKEVGAFDVRIRLFPEVEFEAKVRIAAESSEGGAAAPPPAGAAAGEKEATAAEKPVKAKKEKAEKSGEAAPAAAPAEAEAKPEGKEKKARKK